MVFNNSTLGMVRAEMMVVGYEPFGTDVINPDFGELARPAGIHGERVEEHDDIRPAIERALTPGSGVDRLRDRPSGTRDAAQGDARAGQGVRTDLEQADVPPRRGRGVEPGPVKHP